MTKMGLVWAKQIKREETRWGASAIKVLGSHDCCRSMLAGSSSPLQSKEKFVRSGTIVRCEKGHTMTLSEEGTWEIS